jgi:hypothetical protein
MVYHDRKWLGFTELTTQDRASNTKGKDGSQLAGSAEASNFSPYKIDH